MRKLMVVAAMALCGCATTYPAKPIAVRLAGNPELRCIDRALTLSRITGYIEQTIDKDTGFFRVVARNGVGRRPSGHLRNFNVACLDESSVLITPIGHSGVLSPNDKRTRLNKNENKEIREYAASLGMPFDPQQAVQTTPVSAGPDASPPPPPPPAP